MDDFNHPQNKKIEKTHCKSVGAILIARNSYKCIEKQINLM